MLFALACFGQAPAPKDPNKDADLESLFQVKVVTATKLPQDVSDAPGVISVITRDEIQRFGGLTLREVLERVGSLSFTTGGFTDRSMIAALGDQTKTNGSHILFLINGRPTREVLEGGIDSDLLEVFPIRILERIEVIEGPGSVLYGSNAYSGVINLITRKVMGNEAAFSAFGSGTGQQGGTAEVLVSHGDLNIVGAAQFHQTPDWRVDYQNPFFPAPAQSVEIGDHSAGAYLGLNYKGLSVMTSLMQYRTSYFLIGLPGVDRWRRGFADIGYHFKPRSRWEVNLNATYSRTALNTSDPEPIRRIGGDLVLEWSNTIHASSRDDIVVGALLDHNQGNQHFLGFGQNTVDLDAERSGESFYFQIEHRFSNALSVIGGYQSNKVDTIRSSTVPRFGLMWKPNDRWHVKALYGAAYRAPSLHELELNNAIIQGDPNLRPERVRTLETSVSYQRERLRSELSLFASRQYDNIVAEPNQNFVLVYQNLDSFHSYGVEWNTKYYFTHDFFATGSMFFRRVQEWDGDSRPTPTSRSGGKLGISYSGRSGPLDGWTASVFDVYQGRIPAYASSVNPAPAAFHLVSAHLKLDLSRYFGSAAKNLALFAHGDNLRNTAVWLPDWGGSLDTVPAIRGRTIYFGLEVRIGKD
jgi:outer membrane receptor for ferrienterochelin and colicins